MGGITRKDLGTFQHAPDSFGKGTQCEGAGFLGHVGWEMGHYFQVDIPESDAGTIALRDSGNVMVSMDGKRYDITFRGPYDIEKVVTVKFHEMFRIGGNNMSEVKDVHWKHRTKPPVCAILSIAKLSLSLVAAKWKSPEKQHEYEKRETDYYKRRSSSSMAPVACNANDSDSGGRGYIVGSNDDPYTPTDVDSKPIPGYSGTLEYPPFFPWHCGWRPQTLIEYATWLAAVMKILKDQWKVEFAMGNVPSPVATGAMGLSSLGLRNSPATGGQSVLGGPGMRAVTDESPLGTTWAPRPHRGGAIRTDTEGPVGGVEGEEQGDGR